jgi:FG-GAP-like repeat
MRRARHRSRRVVVAALVAAASLTLAGNSGGAPPDAAAANGCVRTKHKAKVAKPRLVRHIPTGETGWFSSPGLVDLNGDGRLEIVAPDYSTFVFDANGRQLGKGTATKGRVYAPEIVADLDGDKVPEIVVGGNEGTVAAYNLVGGQLQLKPGWPASTCSGGQCPEARGMAAADLDGDGSVEVVVTTTNTSDTGAQVFVFDAAGRPYRPAGAPASAWPRYNTLAGPGNDADFNGVGNHGYGAYGENVGIGNLDDDPQLEIVVTFDNHQINVFNHDGTSVLASPWFTNRQNDHLGARMGWGQFIRWLSPKVEADHYHRHVGPWPDVRKTRWLQWTASPPSVADLDGDGHNEVIGLPNAEMKEPYETQNYAFMVLDGAHNRGARSARRHRGFTNLPLSRKPAVRGPSDYYPPSGIPAPTVVDIAGDRRPEIVSSVPDGAVYAIGPTGRRLWRYDYAHGRAKTFASEVVAADLNRDGTPELVFGTYALAPRSGRLVVLSAAGKKLFDVRLRNQGRDGNGIGVPAAPSIGDLDGDGRLEIVLSSFDHGLDVYRVPGSGVNCLPWPTGRGNLLRNGTGPATA